MKKILMLCIMVLFVSGNAYAAFSNSSGDHSKTVSTQVSINSVCHLDPQGNLDMQQNLTFAIAGRGDNSGYQRAYWTISATDEADLNITSTDNLDSDINSYHYLKDVDSGNFDLSTLDYPESTDYAEFELWSIYTTSANSTPEAGTYTTAVTITCADDDD
jgi:type 1 fimbria pilin